MRDAPVLPMADFVTELAALRLSAVTPREAAEAFVGLLSEPVPCRTFDTMQNLTLAAANMPIPCSLHSSARTALLKLAIIPRLELHILSPGEVLCAARSTGRAAYWLLTGIAVKEEQGDGTDAAKDTLMSWESVGWEAMVGKPYQCGALSVAFMLDLQLFIVHQTRHSRVCSIFMFA
jgi:hypothetical protein